MWRITEHTQSEQAALALIDRFNQIKKRHCVVGYDSTQFIQNDEARGVISSSF